MSEADIEVLENKILMLGNEIDSLASSAKKREESNLSLTAF